MQTTPKGVAIRLLFLLLSAVVSASCSTVAYYAQSVRGQMEVLNKRQDIETLLADPATPPALQRRLALALKIRSFATAELALPNNGSYRSYTDLERPYVVWNVFATPRFSFEPLRWCYPFTGCVSYRGYFSRADAVAFGDRLRKQGYDVYVGPVPAYSTLGWFDDPLLNTMMHWPEPEFAGVMFHELAHQQLFVSGDSAFNESFASMVEREGVRRWMLSTAGVAEYERYLQRRAHEAQFVELVLATRHRLAQLYASHADSDAMVLEKKRLFAQMQAQYGNLRAAWGGYGYYDRWMEQGLNNAQLASVATYHRFVPAFRKILAANQGDMAAFYRAASAVAQMPKPQRRAYLDALVPERAE